VTRWALVDHAFLFEVLLDQPARSSGALGQRGEDQVKHAPATQARQRGAADVLHRHPGSTLWIASIGRGARTRVDSHRHIYQRPSPAGQRVPASLNAYPPTKTILNHFGYGRSYHVRPFRHRVTLSVQTAQRTNPARVAQDVSGVDPLARVAEIPREALDCLVGDRRGQRGGRRESPGTAGCRTAFS
jgi:hypothetical protein